MFWRKGKKVAAVAGVSGEQLGQVEASLPTAEVEVSKAKALKLPGPRDIPDMVGGNLVTEFQRSPDWVWKLRAVVRQRQDNRHAFDVRVFDDVEAYTRKVKVSDYTSLDEHPELILYEGWFDKEALRVQMEEKKKSV